MTEVERVIEQYRRIVHGEAWHGPSLLESLAGLDANGAATRADVCEHSIWQIVMHCLHWQRVSCRKVKGDTAPPADDQNWVTVGDLSERAWQATIFEVQKSTEVFRDVVSALDEASLEKPIGDESDTVYTLLHGIVEHTAYHIGQICMIKQTLSRCDY